MSREHKSEVIRVRCTPKLKKRVDHVAASRETTASEVTREALMEKLEREAPVIVAPEPAADRV